MASRENYARALRTIGQELAKRGIDLFELHCSRAEYYLQCGDPQPPHTNLLKMSFAPEQVVSMDHAAAAHRSKTFKRVDFESLSEILRALGEYVTGRDGTLRRISHSQALPWSDLVSVEYEGRDGKIYRDELAIATIAERAIRMYKSRRQTQPAGH